MVASSTHRQLTGSLPARLRRNTIRRPSRRHHDVAGSPSVKRCVRAAPRGKDVGRFAVHRCHRRPQPPGDGRRTRTSASGQLPELVDQPARFEDRLVLRRRVRPPIGRQRHATTHGEVAERRHRNRRAGGRPASQRSMCSSDRKRHIVLHVKTMSSHHCAQERGNGTAPCVVRLALARRWPVASESGTSCRCPRHRARRDPTSRTVRPAPIASTGTASPLRTGRAMRSRCVQDERVDVVQPPPRGSDRVAASSIAAPTSTAVGARPARRTSDRAIADRHVAVVDDRCSRVSG